MGMGPGWPTSFAWYDPDTSSWRTSQLSLATPISPTPSDGSSVTWPRSGSMHAGRCYPHTPWVPHTHANDCSHWPTPTASMGRCGWRLGQGGRFKPATEQRVRGLIRSTGSWRPPGEAVEWLMGFPTNWSQPASEPLATPSSPRSENTSDASSSITTTTAGDAMTPTPEPAERPALRVAGPEDAAAVLSADRRREPGRIRSFWTAADIMAMEFAPPKWVLPGVTSEGFSLRTEATVCDTRDPAGIQREKLPTPSTSDPHWQNASARCSLPADCFSRTPTSCVSNGC